MILAKTQIVAVNMEDQVNSKDDLKIEPKNQIADNVTLSLEEIWSKILSVIKIFTGKVSYVGFRRQRR